MRNFKSHFKFNKQERSGIFFLLLIIVLLQVGYFIFKSFPEKETQNIFNENIELQAKIEVLKKKALEKDSIKIYPFNPNFISDYKGYTLGMSVEEIDRLHDFRATNKYVNSAQEFQNVTLVSDTLLKSISAHFKFPVWINKNKENKLVAKSYTRTSNATILASENSISSKPQYSDLNLATAEDLRIISGIGEILSNRIVKFRNRLGGFLVEEQLFDVYGLEPEVVSRTLKRFKVLNPPNIEKININTASIEMLTKLIYLQKNTSISIVNYRKLKGSISSFEELSKIENFPVEKIDRIALYLSL